MGLLFWQEVIHIIDDDVVTYVFAMYIQPLPYLNTSDREQFHVIEVGIKQHLVTYAIWSDTY